MAERCAAIHRPHDRGWHNSMVRVSTADIRDFRARDWRLIERTKSDCWIEQKTSMTPSDVFELAGELLQYVRTLRPDWPNTAERQADLASHIRVAGMLQRAGPDRAR